MNNTNEVIRRTEDSAIKNADKKEREFHNNKLFLCKDSNVYVRECRRYVSDIGAIKYYALVYKVLPNGFVISVPANIMTMCKIEEGQVYRMSSIVGMRVNYNKARTSRFTTMIVELVEPKDNSRLFVDSIQKHIEELELKEKANLLMAEDDEDGGA